MQPQLTFHQLYLRMAMARKIPFYDPNLDIYYGNQALSQSSAKLISFSNPTKLKSSIVIEENKEQKKTSERLYACNFKRSKFSAFNDYKRTKSTRFLFPKCDAFEPEWKNSSGILASPSSIIKPVATKPSESTSRNANDRVFEKIVKSEFQPESESPVPDKESEELNTISQQLLLFNSDGSTEDSINKFSVRVDVINKTILRCFKKYYATEFKQIFDLSILKPGTVSVEKLLSKSKEFIDKKFGSIMLEDVYIFVAALVDNKHKLQNKNRKYDKIKEDVSRLLYSFNKRRLNELLTHPEFAYLLLYYLKHPRCIHQLVNNKNDVNIRQAYVNQVELLCDI